MEKHFLKASKNAHRETSTQTLVSAQNQSSIKPIHEIRQTSFNNVSVMNVFKILGGKSSQSICYRANVQPHTLSTRLLTIKAGKDAVCGGLSEEASRQRTVMNDFIQLIYDIMTKAKVPFNFEGRVKACAWKKKLSDWRHHRHTLLFCSRLFSCISRAIKAIRCGGKCGTAHGGLSL